MTEEKLESTEDRLEAANEKFEETSHQADESERFVHTFNIFEQRFLLFGFVMDVVLRFSMYFFVDFNLFL